MLHHCHVPIFDKMIVHWMEMERVGPAFLGLPQGGTDGVSVQKIDHGVTFGSKNFESRIKSPNQRPTVFRLTDYSILESNENDRGVLYFLRVNKGPGFGYDPYRFGMPGHPLEK